MSDFLTRLAERTLGVAPLARPHLSPVFAPAPPETAADNVDAATDAVSEAAPATPGRQSQSTSIQSLAAEVGLEPAVPDKRTQVPPHMTPIVEETARSVHREADKPGIVRPGTRSATPSPQRSTLTEPQPSATPKGAASSDSPGPTTIPTATTHRAASFDRKWADASPPTINVTIGRIEVRAVTPAIQSRAERRPLQLQSLDEYLRSRNEDRR
jgi:hypothetical protein